MDLFNSKKIKASSLLTSGLTIIILGILIVVYNTSMYKLLIKLIALAILINGLTTLIKVLTKKTSVEDQVSLGGVFLNIIIAFILLFFEKIPLSILPIIMSLYMLLNAFIKIINFIIMKKNKISGAIFELISFIFFFLFSLALLFSPLLYLKAVLNIIGIYFILYGLSNVTQFINLVTPNKMKNNLKRNIRISLPVFLVTFIPHNTLKNINKFLQVKEKNPRKIILDKDKKPDIEVIIHVSDLGTGIFGHCDICFEGKIISYGSYDEASSKLFNSIGDGILFTTSKAKYIDLCVNYSKKTLFVFGLKLTDIQKKAVEKKIAEIKSTLYPWHSPYENALLQDKNTNFNDYSDYPSRLFHDTAAKIYKFKEGKFKTYFLMGTNCVLLADTILGASGTDIVKINGIITPGTYYEYLERLYQLSNSNVITKEIYRYNNK